MKKVRIFLGCVLLLSIAHTAFAADTSKNAIVVSWKNSAGYWFAAGPTQATSVGCRSEEEAVTLASGSSRDLTIGSPDNFSSDYKFRVYVLPRKYKSYDMDVHKYMANKFNFYISD